MVFYINPPSQRNNLCNPWTYCNHPVMELFYPDFWSHCSVVDICLSESLSTNVWSKNFPSVWLDIFFGNLAADFFAPYLNYEQKGVPRNAGTATCEVRSTESLNNFEERIDTSCYFSEQWELFVCILVSLIDCCMNCRFRVGSSKNFVYSHSLSTNFSISCKTFESDLSMGALSANWNSYLPSHMMP